MCVLSLWSQSSTEAVLDLGVNTWRDVGGLQNLMPFFSVWFFDRK